MKHMLTVCPRDCYDTCTLNITLGESGQIVSIKGDSEHPITQGFTCPRGAKDHERLYKNRVEAPSIRQGNDFKQIDWETALNSVSRKLAETLKKHGSESVLFLNYAGNTGLLTNTFPQRLWNALGATQTDYAICSKSGHKALALHYGESYGITPDELSQKDLIIFWGFNAAVSAPHIWALARGSRKSRRTKIIVIDPVKTQTAKQSDVWVQPRPGSDVALAYGVIHYLIQHDYIDPDFIKKWTLGFEHLRDEAKEWTPNRVERVTGVTWKSVECLGEAYHTLNPSATMIGIGLQKNDQGADQVRAVSFIPALLGLHRGFFYSNSTSFSVNESLLLGEEFSNNDSKIVEQVALADLVKQGMFRFLYVNCMNPAMTLPNQHAFRKGISREDVFLVVHDTHWSQTAQYADVVLPAPTYLEKEDLVIPWSHSYVLYSPQLIHPVTDSRTEIWVMQGLAKRLNLEEEWLYEDPWNAVATAFTDALEDGDFEALKSGKMLRLKKKPQDRYPTPSGKFEFFSSQAVASGISPLPKQASIQIEEGEFFLLTSAIPQYTSTQFQEVYGAIPAVALMNPQDARRLNITDGDIVALKNDQGQVKMKIVISDTILEGVIWSPRQSEGLTGEPQNCLMSSKPQDIGSGPRFNSTTVSSPVIDGWGREAHAFQRDDRSRRHAFPVNRPSGTHEGYGASGPSDESLGYSHEAPPGRNVSNLKEHIS
jgi:anaerobic selenocysteine-containing dehydrogenase